MLMSSLKIFAFEIHKKIIILFYLLVYFPLYLPKHNCMMVDIALSPLHLIDINQTKYLRKGWAMKNSSIS